MATMNEALRGALYIIGGTILLLHTLNIMKESLQYILIAASLGMIFYGIFKTGLLDRLTDWFQEARRTTKAVTRERAYQSDYDEKKKP